MRQRKVKDLETKYEAYCDLLVYDPCSLRGAWRAAYDGQDGGQNRGLFIEIGCGKGKFIAELAAREPEHLFVAVEGNRSVLLRAMEKVRQAGLTNVRFVPHFIEDITEWFGPGEVSGIYLNFSDPLPKSYGAKKRLTHRSKFAQYFEILDANGIVTFKTDNTDLFEFTVYEVLASDLAILELIRDLHRSGLAEDDIKTEYEAKFSGLGEKIKRIKVGRKADVNGAGMERKLTKTIFAAANGRLLPADAAAAAAEARRTLAKTTVGHRYYGAVRLAGCDTAAVMAAVSNYTCPGDRVLAPADHIYEYNNIAMERGRGVETFRLQEEDRLADLEYKIRKLLRIQDRVLIVLREELDCTAREGWGEYACVYAPEDWARIVQMLNEAPKDKKVTLLIDFTVRQVDDEEPDDVGIDLKQFDGLNDNVLLLLTGERQLSGVAGTEAIRDEFVRFTSFTAEACGL